MKMFRDLQPHEEAPFRQWARENYQALTPISGVWHPVVQDECRRINETAQVRARLLLGAIAQASEDK